MALDSARSLRHCASHTTRHDSTRYSSWISGTGLSTRPMWRRAGLSNRSLDASELTLLRSPRRCARCSQRTWCHGWCSCRYGFIGCRLHVSIEFHGFSTSSLAARTWYSASSEDLSACSAARIETPCIPPRRMMAAVSRGLPESRHEISASRFRQRLDHKKYQISQLSQWTTDELSRGRQQRASIAEDKK